MAKRKRPPTPPVDTRSANEERQDRAWRREYKKAQLEHAETARLQAIRDHALCDRLTTRNAAKSRLLRLPAELRNAVYAYVYAGTKYIIDGDGYFCYWISSKEPVCLSFVCRQTYAEASLLPYKLGIFSIISWGIGSERLWSLEKFLKNRSPEQINATATLKLTYGFNPSPIYWHQTRNAAYWVAKLESLSAEAAKMHWIQRENFHVSDIGPSDA